MKRIDNRIIRDDQDEIRAFLVVRNEMLRLPSTLRHHRALGVNRFFVLDNGSTDGTLDYLAGEPDVHIFATDESYAQSSYGITWTNELLDRFGTGHWTLTIDADEQFIYPHYEKIRLSTFCRHLDATGVEAVPCILLDMYSNLTVQDTVHDPHASLLETCRYFDPGPYRRIRAADPPYFQYYGGVRERIFQHIKAPYHPPTVSKVPLVRWKPGRMFLCSTHSLSAAQVSPLMATLLHFKFLSDFHYRVETEVARGEHYAEAQEYRAYRDLLRLARKVKLLSGQSARFEGSSQLVRLNLMATSKSYEDFVKSTAAGSPAVLQPVAV